MGNLCPGAGTNNPNEHYFECTTYYCSTIANTALYENYE